MPIRSPAPVPTGPSPAAEGLEAASHDAEARSVRPERDDGGSRGPVLRAVGARPRPWLRGLARQRPRLARLVVAAPMVLVVVADLATRGDRLAALRGKYVASYAASMLESGVLWGLLLLCASARRGVLRWAAAVLFVGLGTAAIGGQMYFHGQYSTYLNLDATLFGTSVASSMFGFLRADSVHLVTSMLPPLLVAVGLVWLGRRLVRTPRRHVRWLAGPTMVVLVAVFLIPCSYRSVQASTPDVIYFHAFGGLLEQLGGTPSPAQIRPGRRSPPELPRVVHDAATERNVLLIVTEGIRADASCAVPGRPCETMPVLDSVTPSRIALEQMRSNSTTTAIELAVLWTGLEPTAERDALHSAPATFDFARAAGIEGAFWSSHHPLFANTRLWNQDLAVRFHCSATQLDPLADVDLGADDRLLTARVQAELPELREPFFAVVQYGNTHAPYLIDPHDAPFQPESTSRDPDDNESYRNRYLDSIHYQDKTIAELVRFVRSSPFGARTVILFTSDHGEAFREHGQLGHTGSVFDVELHVPMWVDAPMGTLTGRERSALAGYREVPVHHTDLPPTILDLLGLLDEPAFEPWRARMVGWSLLRPDRPERVEVLDNCTAVWGCAFRNWGVMRGLRKLHAREWDADWLCYDLATDPEELHPLDLDRCRDLVVEAERIYGGLPGRL